MKCRKLLAPALLSIALLLTANSGFARSFNDAQRHEIQQVTHDYLNSHPEILMQMAQKLRAKEQQQQQNQLSKLQQQAPKIVRAHYNQFFHSHGTPVAGNPHGRVTLIEFFDYRCGHCRSAAPVIEQAIESHHDLRVLYKQLPIFKGDSQQAALAALAANEQGKYVAFHNALMKAKQPLNKDQITKVAQSVGVNASKLFKDMRSSDLQVQLDQNFALAKALLQKTVGYVFTPIIIVSNSSASKVVLLPGAVSEKALDGAIHKVE